MSFQSKLSVLISRQEIEIAVNRLADEISKDYWGKNPILISILKGSFVFLADLIRRLDLPLEIEFVKLSSYGRGKESSGRIRVVQGFGAEVKNRHVLIVEDIIDTGLTTNFLLDYLHQKEPSSIKLCALTNKPSRSRFPVTIDYLGFTVPDKFLVGYGLDYDEKFRNLPDICSIEGEQ